MTVALPARIRRALLLRSFLIQGSWNYRTMIGTGMAWALLPLIRHLEQTSGGAGSTAAHKTAADATSADETQARLARHAAHFNAHPYLASLAVGSLARLELDGADDALVRRFRAALPGPLGGLGDRVVWAGWLPFTSLWALALYWAGLSPWLTAAVFLALYNAGHLALRVWGFRVGLAEGQHVGARLRTAALVERVQRLMAPAALLLGAVVGLLVVRGEAQGWLGALPAAAGFAAGALGGPRLWRPAALVTVIVLAAVLVAGLAGWTPSAS